MPKTVNIHEAKTHLSRLLEDVRNGERVTIAKAGQPIADLVPHHKVDIVFGSMAGEFEYDEDAFLTSDPEVLELFDDDLELQQ